MNTAIIGASDKPDRYAYKALQLLQSKGHKVFPVNKRLSEIDGVKVFADMKDINEKIDTVTLYVNKDISSQLSGDILAINPRRIIMNPGTENPELEAAAKAKGTEVIYACTLVLLNTGQF